MCAVLAMTTPARGGSHLPGAGSWRPTVLRLHHFIRETQAPTDFSYPQGSWNQLPVDASLHRQLCFRASRETPGSDGMPRTTAGRTRTATQATAATPSTHSLHVNDGQAVVRHGVLTPRTRAAAPTFTPWSPFSPGSPRAPFSPYREKIKTRRH